MQAPTEALTSRHFVLQHNRPSHLTDVDLAAMEPFLRCLLFTDGTVTRTLEVEALSRVSVDLVAQSTVAETAAVARHLDTPAGAELVQRRVTIGAGEPVAPLIWAESHIVPGRLPKGFLDLLSDAPEGIGQSLQEVRLESWRDMLWFGLGSRPAWGVADGRLHGPAITRLYRVIVAGAPALLIRESIAVTMDDGVYRLDWR